MNNILEPLLNSPDLSTYVAELTKVLQEEELKRNEFLNWLDEDHKAEFIKGEVIIHSPARMAHILAMKKLEQILDRFVEQHNLGLVLQEQAMLSLKRSNLMPDLAFWEKKVSNSFTGDTKLFPPPAFVIEVLSPSTEDNDRGYKKSEYASNGVQEYWLVSPEQRTVEQYILKEEEYHLKEKLAHGTVQCYVLNGLEIALTDIFGTNE